jgi:hypothetical protein
MRSLRQDVFYVLRQMSLSPNFALTAMRTLAVGIGATSTIFSLIHSSVMFKSLPVADPARLFRVADSDECCVNGGPQDNWGLFPYRSGLHENGVQGQAPHSVCRPRPPAIRKAS